MLDLKILQKLAQIPGWDRRRWMHSQNGSSTELGGRDGKRKNPKWGSGCM